MYVGYGHRKVLLLLFVIFILLCDFGIIVKNVKYIYIYIYFERGEKHILSPYGGYGHRKVLLLFVIFVLMCLNNYKECVTI